MYYDSNIDPIGLDLVKNEQEFKTCCIDDKSYPKEEMAYDKDGTNWVHRDNINAYMEGFKKDMFWQDWIDLKHNLLKQVK